jgi:hypothetical protein
MLTESRNYSVQQDAHGNIIVCGDDRVRRGYTILFCTACYADALSYKARNTRPNIRRAA